MSEPPGDAGIVVHHGSCHCGAVRFTAAVDPARPTVQCNCTLCTKQRSWVAIVPRAGFTLLAGGDGLGEYRCNSRAEAHRFCATCGVRVFHTGESPRRGAYVAVSVACLDDLDADALAALPVVRLDGRAGTWTEIDA